MASDVRLADGAWDWSGGVDSGRVTTIQSRENPNGLPRNMLAWMDNCTVRGGGIYPRTGWLPVLLELIKPPALFQGAYVYEPNFADPYLIISVSGNIYSILVEAPFTVTNLSAQFKLFNPATPPKVWMAQGEQFLVIQPGDYLNNKTPTLPLFWDGTTLRRSKGITNNAIAPGTPGVNEIPGAGAMVYWQQRLWYAQGRQVSAGDIVGGPSGTNTPATGYQNTDSILEVTENPLVLGGDGFRVPAQAGNILALNFNANQDTTLGQGPLIIGTRKQIYSLQVPVSRAQWIATGNQASGAATQAVQMIPVQLKWGPTSDICMVHVNGDLFYQSLEPGIRSLFTSTRFFSQWGNRQISRNEQRILQFINRALMPFAHGVEFDNRLIMSAELVQTPVGVAAQSLIPLDFDIISQFGQQGNDLPPAWEGMHEPPFDVLQLLEGDFGGRQRCFGIGHSRLDDSIGVWEFTDFSKTDGNSTSTDNRISWIAEFPAFDFGHILDLKELDGGEIWLDQISGTVILQVQYRADADPCWQDWFTTQFCTARNPNELPGAAAPTSASLNYPSPTFCDQGQKFPISFPKPKDAGCASMNARPYNQGFQFQPRIIVKGWCRVRGLLLYALPRDRQPFFNLPRPLSTLPPVPGTPQGVAALGN